MMTATITTAMTMTTVKEDQYENMTKEEMWQAMLATMNGTNYDTWGSDWTVLHEKRWQMAIITLYTLVIVFGFFANLLIVLVIVRYKQLHTVTNIFICYLALADVALCVFNLPLQLHYQLHNSWHFGRVLCSIAMPTFGVPLFSSSMAILMIAVDRYMLIVYPFKKRMTNAQAILNVVAILVVTVALSTPLFVYVNYKEITHPFIEDRMIKIVCSELWPSFAQKQLYSVTIFLLQFVVPISLTSFFYMHICKVLHNRPVKKHDTRRNQRTNRILIAVVLTFTLCWLPWNLFVLTSEFSHKLVMGRYFTLIDLMLKLFAMSSACINPFLYGWLNGNFKKELGKLFGYRWCWKNDGGMSCASYSRTTDINGGATLLRTDACTNSNKALQKKEMMVSKANGV